jgi:hypothetical protein
MLIAFLSQYIHCIFWAQLFMHQDFVSSVVCVQMWAREYMNSKVNIQGTLKWGLPMLCIIQFGLMKREVTGKLGVWFPNFINYNCYFSLVFDVSLVSEMYSCLRCVQTSVDPLRNVAKRAVHVFRHCVFLFHVICRVKSYYFPNSNNEDSACFLVAMNWILKYCYFRASKVKYLNIPHKFFSYNFYILIYCVHYNFFFNLIHFGLEIHEILAWICLTANYHILFNSTE